MKKNEKYTLTDLDLDDNKNITITFSRIDTEVEEHLLKLSKEIDEKILIYSNKEIKDIVNKIFKIRKGK